ncbi:trypsin-like serine peptidase [Kitasatospora sp. NPDC001664]
MSTNTRTRTAPGRRAAAAGALLITAATAVALPPAAFAATAGGSGLSVHTGATTAPERARIDAYWTPDRMRLAGALIPEITPVPEDDHTPADPRPLPADTPDPGAVWTHGGAVERSVGRLFFTFSDGYDGSCTATVVTAPNRSTVVTAAHCLRGAGPSAAADTWRHNLYFVPGYRNGGKPLGGFSVAVMATSSAWDTAATSDEAALGGHDAATAVLNRSADGRRVADVTGSQRIAFSPPREGEFTHAFGYPKDRLNNPEGKYTGSRMIHCAGPVRTSPAAPPLRGTTCDMSHGASGGPQFAAFDTRTGTGTVVGVTTTTEELAGGLPGTLYATRFGDAARQLYDWARYLPS